MAKRKNTDVVQLKLRLVESLRKKLEVAARGEHRSLNSEIVHRLEESFASLDLSLAPREAGAADTPGRGSLAGLLRDKGEREAPARSRLLGARRLYDETDETDERWQATLRATADGYRRNAKRHEARGAHEKAAEALEWANKIERDAGALTQGQAPHQPASDQEPELPIPKPRHRTK
jgi:hypothetical protein